MRISTKVIGDVAHTGGIEGPQTGRRLSEVDDFLLFIEFEEQEKSCVSPPGPFSGWSAGNGWLAVRS